jgi:hypothetical protein
LEFSLDVEFSKKQLEGLKNAKPKGKRARTSEGEMTPQVLKGLLAHSDIKGRALFLLLESSGVRIGEALQLTFDDIDLESTPPKITVRGENAKEGDAYFSFMSVEALESMREWLKVRDEYITTATKRGSGLFQTGFGRGQKDAADKRIFPFSDSVAEMMFTNAIKKLGLHKVDTQTGRGQFRIHMLRKFFMSQMKLKIPVEIVEALCGHSGYLSEAYRRYSRAQIAEFYLKGESVLHLNVPAEFNEIRSVFQTKVDESEGKINDLYQKLTDSNLYVNKLRERLEDMEIDKKSLEAKLSAIDERLKNAIYIEDLYEDVQIVDGNTGKIIPTTIEQKKMFLKMGINGIVKQMMEIEGRKDLGVKQS